MIQLALVLGLLLVLLLSISLRRGSPARVRAT
jgi:hypothetical protein